MVLISFHMAVIQRNCKMYITGVVSWTIHLAVGVQRFQPNLWKANNHNLFKILNQVLGRIQDIVCTQLNAFKREIRVDQEEALSGDVKKLKASDKLVFKKKWNEMNFKSFETVDGSLDDAWASLEKRKLEQVARRR